jgi:hypothetical protein
MPHNQSAARFAICIDNSEYPASLEKNKLYRLIPDEVAAQDGDLRVVDESGEDYLYPANYFVVLEVPRETASQLDRALAHSRPPTG